MTRVVNKNKEAFDHYCGRPSLFGNPFVIGKDGTREEVIQKYRDYFTDRMRSDKEFRLEAYKLKNKILGCHCKPANCHCDVIAARLNNSNGLAIIGSRTFNDYDRLCRVYDLYFSTGYSFIVFGGAIGADLLAKKLCLERNLDYIEFLPDWSLGRGAGLLRNRDIINCCTNVLCFWDGISKGSANSLGLAKKMKKDSFIFYF